MKVLSYIKDNDGSSFHRVFLPNNLLPTEVKTVRGLSEDDLAWCDILHYNRHTSVSPKFIDQFRKKYGFKIIVDCDDWWEVGKDHPKYEWWVRSNVALQIMSHLIYADAVTTTHERLKNIIPNDNVYVVPNGIMYGYGQFKYKVQPQSERVRLLYASTVMNYSNTFLIAGAMKKLKHLPIEIVICGSTDSIFFETIVNNLTANKDIPYRTMPWSGVSKYMEYYEGDIGILPSKPSMFNSMKSNLKVLEYASLKIPVVCSEAEPYIGLPVDFFTGEKSFIDQITRLVESSDLRKDRGDILHNHCIENYNLKNFTKNRLEVYEIFQRSHSNLG